MNQYYILAFLLLVILIVIYRQQIGLLLARLILSDLEYLVFIKNYVAFLPIEKKARYADLVIVENCQQITMKDLGHTQGFETWNTTSIGNMAYIGLNSKNEDVRVRCLELLLMYQTYLRKIK